MCLVGDGPDLFPLLLDFMHRMCIPRFNIRCHVCHKKSVRLVLTVMRCIDTLVPQGLYACHRPDARRPRLPSLSQGSLGNAQVLDYTTPGTLYKELLCCRDQTSLIDFTYAANALAHETRRPEHRGYYYSSSVKAQMQGVRFVWYVYGHVDSPPPPELEQPSHA